MKRLDLGGKQTNANIKNSQTIVNRPVVHFLPAGEDSCGDDSCSPALIREAWQLLLIARLAVSVKVYKNNNNKNNNFNNKNV